MTTQTSRPKSSAADNDKDTDYLATGREVVSDVAERAGAVVAKLPDAAATTRGAVEEANRRMEAGTDEMLAVGASLSLGLAIGMLVAGGNRILVALALIPATAMGFTLFDRYTGGRSTPASRRSA